MVKNLAANAGDIRDTGSIPGFRRSRGGGQQLTLVFLPGESHGQRAGYSHRFGKSRIQLKGHSTQSKNVIYSVKRAVADRPLVMQC